MTTCEELFQFIRSQPPDREINHGGGWCGCSIGEFIREDRNEEASIQIYNSVEAVTGELHDDHGYIYECLNNGGLNSIDNTHIDTYGGLASVIAKNKDRTSGDWYDEQDAADRMSRP